MRTQQKMTVRRPWAMVLGLSAWVVATSVVAPGHVRAARWEPPTTAASEGTIDPLGQGLVIRVADSVPEAEIVRGWIEERGRAVLAKREQGLEPIDLIRVAVRGGAFDYHVRLQVRRHGKNLSEQPEPLECACGSDEMLAQVGEAIEAAAEQLAAVAAEERAAKEQAIAEERERERPEAAGAVNGRHGKRRLRPMGYAGIGVGLAGVGALIAGTAMAVAEPKPIGNSVKLVRDWAPAGYVALAFGGTALVAGATMLVTDLVRCRQDDAPPPCSRQKERFRGRAQLQLGPAMGARNNGIAIGGRF